MPSQEPSPTARGRAGERRASILEALRGTRHGLGVKDLVGLTGLHDNTVRFHLDQLVADGLVDKQPGVTERPGRPPLTYVARREPDEARDNYALIARVLGNALAGSTGDAAEVARDSGRAWGRAAGGGTQDWDTALDRLVTVQQAEGFSPELVEDAEGMLYTLGFSDLRIRLNGEIARVQLPVEQMLIGEIMKDTIRMALSPWFKDIVLEKR